ncbi:hypothetical protein TNCV_4829681 [Trichonephila clavipes]|nr:hypothetical protein TNCV_4829681 [Trichonephila clavipes]
MSRRMNKQKSSRKILSPTGNKVHRAPQGGAPHTLRNTALQGYDWFSRKPRQGYSYHDRSPCLTAGKKQSQLDTLVQVSSKRAPIPVVGKLVEEVVDLFKQINLKLDSDDAQELLDSHNQELTTDEFIEMHEQEQDICNVTTPNTNSGWRLC